jgi:hypothetical protein
MIWLKLYTIRFNCFLETPGCTGSDKTWFEASSVFGKYVEELNEDNL